MRWFWKSRKCYTDDFKNKKKMFFLTLLDSINVIQKYFENVEISVVKCPVYKIWEKNLKFLTRIFEIFLEELNWIKKWKKKYFFVFKGLWTVCYKKCLFQNKPLLNNFPRYLSLLPNVIELILSFFCV
jgi:hypothetical protein